MNPWRITFEKLDLERESLYEALFTLGNGYIGLRGSMPEYIGSRAYYPGMYIAGVFNKLETPVAGRKVMNEDFVNCPNWLFLNYRLDGGKWLDLKKVKILASKRELNMRKGVMSTLVRWQDDQGRITEMASQRIISMAEPHYGAQKYVIRPKNYSAQITIRSGIDGSLINAGVERYRQLNSKHLEPLVHGSFAEDGIYLQMQTNQSKIQITEAMRTRLFQGELELTPDRRTIIQGKERVFQEFSFKADQGEEYIIEKIVSIYTSRDQGVSDGIVASQEAVQKIESFHDLYIPHAAKWRALWKRFDIELVGDVLMQRLLRFHIFHLLQTASSYNEDVDAGLPARGLHGEAYRGHVFWDEIFALPFYSLHANEISRALLMYRYRRLNPAREYAREHGYEGAMYPWQSGSSGYEETQTLHLNPLSKEWGDDYSCLQRHVSIAIACNVINYYKATLDDDFMARYGAEIVLEIAHFWSSIAHFNPARDRFEIHGVMGPDEFHEKIPGSEKGGLPNNAYTNIMATWVLYQGLEILKNMEDEESIAMRTKLNLSSEELSRWESMTKKMFVPMDANGLIHQFEGYMDLKELDWDEYRHKYDDIHRLDRILKAEGLSPDDYKLSKQPDVLMTFFMLNEKEITMILKNLGYDFRHEMIKLNYDYYLQRTSHGSTLSYVVHGHVAHLIGHDEEAMEYFMHALRSDFYDIQGGTTSEGIHVGAMGGSIELFYRMFAGMQIMDDRISFAPRLPSQIEKIKFQIMYNFRWLHIEISKTFIKILVEKRKTKTIKPPSVVPVVINNQVYMFTAGKAQEILL
ncbi:glycoside hydrolase family 65 protein [bacterium]|nr:glycoside hydrolase family 65 protein [bacterium]